jgi:hypothetical protein
MVLVCKACESLHEYNDRGLRQHQLHCEEYIQADSKASTVENALEIYQRKLERRKKKAPPNGTIPVTGIANVDPSVSIRVLFYAHYLS